MSEADDDLAEVRSLIVRMREGDVDAGEVLFRKLDPLIQRVADDVADATQVDNVVSQVQMEIFDTRDDFPEDSVETWIRAKANSAKIDGFRKQARVRRAEEKYAAAKQGVTAPARAEREPRKKKPQPLWLMPAWLAESVRPHVQQDDVRTWEEARGPSMGGAEGLSYDGLQDILDYDPIVVGPASMTEGAHPMQQFPGIQRSLGTAIAAGRSIVVLVPQIGWFHSRQNLALEALFNQTLSLIEGMGVRIEGAQVPCVGRTVTTKWFSTAFSKRANAWLTKHGGRQLMEFSMPSRAGWHFESLIRAIGSPGSLIGMAEGPGRILVLPLAQTPLDEVDVTVVRSLATEVRDSASAIGFTGDFKAADGFEENEFRPLSGGAPLYLEAKVCAFLWCVLKEPNARVPNGVLAKRMRELRYFKDGGKSSKDGDKISTLRGQVNRAFMTHCRRVWHRKPYAILTYDDDRAATRLRFPNDFTGYLGLDIPPSGRKRPLRQVPKKARKRS